MRPTPSPLRLLALVSCGTRSVIDAVLRPLSGGETTCAPPLLASLRAGMILLADRNFGAGFLAAQIAATRAEFLIRVRTGNGAPKLPVPCQNQPCPAEPTLDFGVRGHGAANADLDAIQVYLREELLLAKVEAGADPVVITGWMKETQAKRALAEARLNKPTAARRQLTEKEITALVANVDGIMQALKDADRADKADLYSRLQVTLKYYPSEKRVAAEARPGHRPNRSSRRPASRSAMSPSRSPHPISRAVAEAISWEQAGRPASRPG